MAASFLVTFREALEAALVIGIVLTIIKDKKGLASAVWTGLAAGLALSALGAWLFSLLAGGFEGQAEQIFEACVLFTGGALLTGFLLWIKHASSKTVLSQQIDKASTTVGAWVGVFLVVLSAVLREGIETILYLAGIIGPDSTGSIIGGSLGILAATAIGLAMFILGKKLPLGAIFNTTKILIVLFAAGIVASLVHELNDLGIVPVLIDPVWNLGAKDSLLGKEGSLGGILHGLFGWSSTPTLSMVLAWAAYLGVVGTLVFRKPAKK